MRLIGLFVVVVLMVAGCATGTDLTEPPTEPPSEPAATLGDEFVAQVCGPFNRTVEPADDLLVGEVAIPHFETVTSGDEIDWSMDPHSHPSWRFGFHSLDFVWPSVAATIDGGPDEHIDRTLEVIASWLDANPFADPASDFSWNDHATAKRTHLMACVHTIAPRDWLDEAIRDHVEILSREDFYSAHTNHGISQDIALFIAGCATGSDEILELAEGRAAEAAAGKVDPQGVLDEQAPGYQGYVLRQYRWFAAIAESCRRDLTGIIPDLDAMADALAHMRMPDGRLVPLGDTYWTPDPASDPAGLPQGPVTKIYDEAGYVLVRGAGGVDATFYAIRFGPGRYIHGHDDHTSVFLFAHGAPRLIEGGHVGYEQTPFRRYLQGPMSHNVTVAEGVDFDRDATTELVAHDATDGEQFYRLRDTPHTGVTRQRDVHVFLDEPSLTVVDTMRSDEPHTYVQLWHLPPETTIDVEGSRAVATFPDGLKMYITQELPVDSIDVVQGQEDPYLGWFAAGHTERVAAPVLVTRINGASVEYRTAVTLSR